MYFYLPFNLIYGVFCYAIFSFNLNLSYFLLLMKNSFLCFLTFPYFIDFFIVVVVELLFLLALVLYFETNSLSSRAELTLFTQASSSPSEFQGNRAVAPRLASSDLLSLPLHLGSVFFPLFVMRCESYFSILFS